MQKTAKLEDNPKWNARRRQGLVYSKGKTVINKADNIKDQQEFNKIDDLTNEGDKTVAKLIVKVEDHNFQHKYTVGMTLLT